ncbi:flagellar hook-associated protein FlgL [bacterium]|nr:flagellar hook-associated protein FlgL [bacterium]
MVNRVSSSGRYAMLLADMQMNQYNFERLTAQLTSGSKITNITDDPIAAVNILNTNKQLGQIETFETNVAMASSELAALDDLLSLSTGYLSQAWDRAVQANNQTYGESSLKALKVEIDEITKTMVDLANSEYNDNYIFSGANTKTLAYTIDENGDIVYNGTPHDNPDYIRQTEVSDGVFETINTTGDKVFGYYRAAVPTGQGVYTDENTGKRVIKTTENDATGNPVEVYRYENGTICADISNLTEGAEEEVVGVMGALKQLSNSLQMVIDGDTEEGYKKMNETLDMFSDSLNTITTEQTKFGGVANRLDMTSSTLETSNESLTTLLSEVRDIDYAEAITQWMNAQYAYQASLQVSSASMNMSLLNYL